MMDGIVKSPDAVRLACEFIMIHPQKKENENETIFYFVRFVHRCFTGSAPEPGAFSRNQGAPNGDHHQHGQYGAPGLPETVV